MKKYTFIIVLGFCMAFSGIAHAQFVQEDENSSMRSLALQSMQEYAHQVYERGDYQEAAHVFLRILRYDASNADARKYLADIQSKGIAVKIPAMPIVVAPPVTVATAPVAVEQKSTPVMNSVNKTDNTAHLDDDLAQLQNDLHQMRESLHAKAQQLNTLEQQIQ